ncbi:serine/threonine protein kinase [Rhodospirillales bacterium URHD0017]|nr:serine/threonine protein kinase [Rhodospirillales bacterium URHD0017]
MQPLPPNIGRYVVEELVGVGGMGQIYRAQDPVLRRTVAIKLISTKLMSGADRADYIKRFRREAEAAARCAHPNIVAVYDFALHEEQPYLAMEFVAGQSLRQLLDDEPVMAVPDAIGIMEQVLDALTSAHEQGVIHQDIKPGNIMLTADHRVKVGDFGISKLMNVETTTIFSTIGTPSYMSPEQCRGDEIVDGRSDIFSAGAMLYEMVAGERAFQGRNVTEVSHRIQNDSLPLLPAHVRNAAPRLQLVLERAMGKHPADRFDTGADMADALRQVLKEASPDSTRIAPEARVTTVVVTPRAPREDSAGRRPHPPLDPTLLKTLEEKLRDYVGPVARVLVQTGAARGRSAADLVAEVSLSVPDQADRERFLRETASLVRLRPPTPPTGGPPLSDSSGRGSGRVTLPEQELERAQAALTQFVGPIARVLVRRAAASTSSVEVLWQALSTHIESPAERAAFLKQRQS